MKQDQLFCLRWCQVGLIDDGIAELQGSLIQEGDQNVFGCLALNITKRGRVRWD